MSKAALKSLPVLMHHYIGDVPGGTVVSPQVFEEQCRVLAEHGWFGVGLAEAEEFLLRGEPLPPKSFLITFDDGYLDNYVHAWPILRKYGHKAVIFAVADRVSAASVKKYKSKSPGRADRTGKTDNPEQADHNKPVYGHPAKPSLTRASGVLRAPRPERGRQGMNPRRPGLRYTLDDVWNGLCRPEDLPPVNSPMQPVLFPLPDLPEREKEGRAVCSSTFYSPYETREDLFFNWEEARAMEASGVISVAAHSMSHTSVFSAPLYSDFFKPEETQRTFWQSWPYMRWGMPRFKQCSEFRDNVFLPSDELLQAVQNIVPQQEDQAYEFFRQSENVSRLRAAVAEVERNPRCGLGSFEGPEAMLKRMRAIMLRNRAVLARELGHSVRSFCWPWGTFSIEALKMGLEAGFEVFYAAEPGLNLPGGARCVQRFKVRNKSGRWLLNRLRLYSRPGLGGLYLKMRI